MKNEIIFNPIPRKIAVVFGFIFVLPVVAVGLAIKGAWHECSIELPLEIDSLKRFWATGRTGKFKE